jgi:CRISPR system Cascade subunit CasD
MQSWGVQSRFRYRDTGLEPSKSGVIGLLCAALGRPRTAPVDDLAALLMGVRVDGEGVVKVDFQTAGGSHRRDEQGYGVAQFDGSPPDTAVSYRYYLADANYLVGLEADTPAQETLLRQLDQSLAHPVWSLYLGRRAFPPGEPIRLPDVPPLGPGLRSEPLREALQRYPWPAERPDPVRFVLEDPTGQSGESRLDHPVSFAPLDRRYMPRFVRTEFLARPDGVPMSETEAR